MNFKHPKEFKTCNKCERNLKYDKFRLRKDVGWTDITGKMRYTYCKECEKKRFKDAYKKNPIPQMLSNSKIRAKVKKFLIIYQLMTLKKFGLKTTFVLF